MGLRMSDVSSLFARRSGRDLTARLFWKYVRNQVCGLLAGLILALSLEPYESFALLCVDFMVMALMGIYSLVSLRLRKIEERIEAGRGA